MGELRRGDPGSAAGQRWAPALELAAPDFHAAARSALSYLRQRLGFSTWVVGRLIGDDWVVTEALDSHYGLRTGDRAPWSSTYCARMAGGLAPRFAPRVSEIPAYAEAALAGELPAGAYLGVPLAHDGQLLGALCALDPGPVSPSIAGELQMVELTAQLLAALLAQELASAESRRTAERAEIEAYVDPLTQLGSRLAWNTLLAEEEERCRRYERSACIVTLDLDGLKQANDTFGHEAGDRMLRQAALALRRASRMCDHVARVGGDEFAVLAVECEAEAGLRVMRRLEVSLSEHGVEASLGFAPRDPARGLIEAWQAADAAMYADKRNRRIARVQTALSLDSPAGAADAPPAPRGAPRQQISLRLTLADPS